MPLAIGVVVSEAGVNIAGNAVLTTTVGGVVLQADSQVELTTEAKSGRLVYTCALRCRQQSVCGYKRKCSHQCRGRSQRKRLWHCPNENRFHGYKRNASDHHRQLQHSQPEQYRSQHSSRPRIPTNWMSASPADFSPYPLLTRMYLRLYAIMFPL